MQKADRLGRLPLVPTYEARRRVREARARGVPVIGLEMGDPDLPTPPHVVDALTRALADPTVHRYPSEGVRGIGELREAVAAWYGRRFGVSLDPGSEVLALLGSKEGSHHLALAVLNPGDIALVPDPAFQTYAASAAMAGAEVVPVPLSPADGYLVDFSAIPEPTARRARVMWLSYPNNPTTAVAPLAFYERAVEFAARYDILLVSDNPYTEIAFDGLTVPSLLEVDGAKDLAVEFHSLSKTYCMAGWRLGMAVGNADLVADMTRVKEATDAGVFEAVQRAGVAALEGPQTVVREYAAIYQRRRDIVVEALHSIGVPVEIPRATIYVWVPVPAGMTSMAFALRMLDVAAVVVTPGIGYGSRGEGFVRLSLTVPDELLTEAMARIVGAWDRIIDPGAPERDGLAPDAAGR